MISFSIPRPRVDSSSGVPEAQAEALVAALKDAGLSDAAKIGEIVDAPAEEDSGSIRP